MNEPITIAIGYKEIFWSMLGYLGISVSVMFGGWWLFLKEKLKQIDDHEEAITHLQADWLGREYLNNQAREIKSMINRVDENTGNKLDHINTRVDEIYKILPK